MKSKWVEEEYYRALSLTKSKRYPPKIIPVILQTAKLPGFLENYNWVDFRKETEFSESLEKLIWGITGQKKYKSKRYQAVESRYIDLALKAYDIIDLGNLPDQDFRIATQRLDLRNLFVSLRVKTEIEANTEAADAELEAIEKRRKAAIEDISNIYQREGIVSKQIVYDAVPIGSRLDKARQLIVKKVLFYEIVHVKNSMKGVLYCL